jgi:hypothetical protein
VLLEDLGAPTINRLGIIDDEPPGRCYRRTRECPPSIV